MSCFSCFIIFGSFIVSPLCYVVGHFSPFVFMLLCIFVDSIWRALKPAVVSSVRCPNPFVLKNMFFNIFSHEKRWTETRCGYLPHCHDKNKGARHLRGTRAFIGAPSLIFFSRQTRCSSGVLSL